MTAPGEGAREQIRSSMGWSTRTRIVAYGYDLPDELLGTIDLGGVLFLGLTGRKPDAHEARVLNSLLVSLVEHGLTPSALAARITYLGAPEAMQAAVASGLAGLGSVFVGSMEGAARILQERLPEDPAADLLPIAAAIVDEHLAAKAILPGIGHPKHKPIDPRVPRLFAIAEEEGIAGRHCTLMQAIGQQGSVRAAKELPLNATGAIAAIASDLGLHWTSVRGIGVAARAVGLVAHLAEEARDPLAKQVWLRLDAEASQPHIDAAGG